MQYLTVGRETALGLCYNKKIIEEVAAMRLLFVEDEPDLREVLKKAAAGKRLQRRCLRRWSGSS